LVGIIVYIAWTVTFTAIPILIIKGLGFLRVTDEVQAVGLDLSDCSTKY
jgi:ammonia channel protein AmtB